jgi:hypothetical protein
VEGGDRGVVLFGGEDFDEDFTILINTLNLCQLSTPTKLNLRQLKLPTHLLYMSRRLGIGAFGWVILSISKFEGKTLDFLFGFMQNSS